ncbi:MAG: DUF4430 domain-containing protein [Coriobacteriales bacterium]|jgi:hypothetical protein|nr:DUF4430 domain-containing protein [Coriobacteriales bacterium]
MPKRLVAILTTLIVLAIGVSAYALAPMLLADADAEGSAPVAGDAVSRTSAHPGSAADSGAEASLPGTTASDDAEGIGGGESGGSGNPGNPGSASSGSGNAGGSGNGGASGSGAGNAGNTGGSGGPRASGNTAGSGSGPAPASHSDSSGPGSSADPAPASDSRPIVTLSIDASTMGRGYLMAPRSVTFSPGESVFDVLSRECRSSGMPMEHSFNPMYNSVYVEGINNLYEFDGGPQSGWMYAVNGWFPNYGCSVYALSEGDVIQWRYTCNLGSDIGGANVIGG